MNIGSCVIFALNVLGIKTSYRESDFLLIHVLITAFVIYSLYHLIVAEVLHFVLAVCENGRSFDDLCTSLQSQYLMQLLMIYILMYVKQFDAIM